MATCRDTILGALQALKVLAPGDDPNAEDLIVGLDALSDLIVEIHNARGHMIDVDVTADYVASENERVRVQAGFTVNVTLPNAIPLYLNYDPFDYGFSSPSLTPPVGSTASADGIQFRQPRDGTRVEIVGTSQALYFYRADLNEWMAATGLSLDTELPFNNRYSSSIDAMLAERIMDVVADAEPTPGLLKRIARGNAAMMLQTGTARDPVRAQYF